MDRLTRATPPPKWMRRMPRWWHRPAPRGMVLVLILLAAVTAMAAAFWVRAVAEESHREVLRVERVARADVCQQVGIILQVLPRAERRRALLRLGDTAVRCGYATPEQLDGIRRTEAIRSRRPRGASSTPRRAAPAPAPRRATRGRDAPRPPAAGPRLARPPRPRQMPPALDPTPTSPPRHSSRSGRPSHAGTPGPPPHSNAPPHAGPQPHARGGHR